MQSSQPTTDGRRLITYALFAGWISILVTNFFGFSVVIVQIFFFLFPAIIITFNRSGIKLVNLPLRKFIARSLAVAAPLAGTAIVVIVWVYWYADTLYAKGYRLNRSGSPEAAKPLLEDAIILNPGEPNFHDELANTLSAITLIQTESGNAEEVTNTAKSSLTQNNIAISISPNNVNYWKTQTKILYGLSSYDSKFNRMAIEALTKALDLSPNDPKIVYNLAILYGRENDPVRAIALMEKAKSIKPNYRDAYYGLSVMYAETGQTVKSREILREYLDKVDPNDAEFREKVK
jgi:tetratricopeptide (TPR) repeat protein